MDAKCYHCGMPAEIEERIMLALDDDDDCDDQGIEAVCFQHASPASKRTIRGIHEGADKDTGLHFPAIDNSRKDVL